MQLVTFGGLKLENSSFARLSPLLLLTYLALEGRQSRRDVAELFWLGYKNPLTNLSMALSHLRKLEPDLVQADKHWVEANIACDAVAFLEALPSEEALGLYKGSFLEGLYFGDWNSEVEAWAYEKREYLAAQAQAVLLKQVEQSIEASQLTKAKEQLERAYTLSGAALLSESDLLRAYRLAKTLEHDSADKLMLDIEDRGLELPEAAPIQQLEPKAEKRQTTVPSPPLAIVGRELELSELRTMFVQEDCRLVTITGPSGAGKSRLAMEVAKRFEQEGFFKDGVVYVSLFGVKDFHDARRRVGRAIGLSSFEISHSEDSIRVFFEKKQALFVLDSIDHLLELVFYLSDFLKRCPNTKILVTTEERLRMAEEQLYPIKGLAFSDADDPTQLTGALKFFTERAKRVDPKFLLDETNREDVLTICRLVDGSPLALELAATWVKLLPLNVIAAEIESNLDFLKSDLRTPEADYSSVRAAFEQTWQRLESDEKDVLEALACFQVSFSYEAATAVSACSSDMLLNLHDKSLLEVLPNGRFRLFRLVRQFIWQKILAASQLYVDLEARYLAYFQTLLSNFEHDITKEAQMAKVLERIELDLPNIDFAMNLALKHDNIPFVMAIEPTLQYYYDLSGFLAEGVYLYERTLDYLNVKGESVVEAWASYLTGYLNLLYRQSRPYEALEYAESALEYLRHFNQDRKEAELLLKVGQVHSALGNVTASKKVLGASLKLFEELEYSEGLVMAQMAFSELQLLYEDDPPSSPLNLKDFSETEHSRDDLQISIVFYEARYALVKGDLEQAKRLLLKCRELSERLAASGSMPFIQDTLALVLVDQDNFLEAEYYAREGYEKGSSQSSALRAGLAITLGRILPYTEKFEEAQTFLLEGLEVALKNKIKPVLLKALTSLADQYRCVENLSEAKKLYRFVKSEAACLRVEYPHLDMQLEALKDAEVVVYKGDNLELFQRARVAINDLKSELRLKVASN